MLRTAAFFSVFSFAVGAYAQDFRATITGRVTDASSSGVANAKVSVHNQATGDDQSQNSSREGDYTIPFLIPGTYSVTVEAVGFKKSVKDHIEVHVNDKVTVNFNMELGAVQDTVTVTDTAPLLDEATATRGGLIENLRVTELPLNGRNPFSLANLATGVVFAGNPQFTRPFDNGDNINFSINGGLRQTNSYLLDGIPDDAVTDADTARTRSAQNIAYIPTVDATQEFKIITNFYDAQYGRTGGGIINVTTKSGGNAFHGTGYDFLRRYQLDANSLQNNSAGRPRYGVDPVTKANLGGHTLDQYGTEITGPVFIPKVYNGKDKTFFAFGFENYHESTPSPLLTSVPSLAERNGDFSAVGVNIYDPLSTRVNPAFDATRPDSSTNPQYIRDQFAGNVIPASRFNTVGRNILNAYPAPNTGAAGAVTNNFIASPNLSEDHFRNYIGRVDQTFSEKERIFVRYAHNRRDQIDNGANGYTGLGKDAQDPLVRINDNAVFDSLTVLNPNTLVDLRIGFTRFIQAAFRTTVDGFDATSIGFPASFSNSRFTQLPPRIEVDQYPAFGTRNPNQNTTNLLSFAPSLSHIHGIHSIKVGADIRDIRANVRGGSFLYGAGDFQFTRNFTQRLPAFGDSSSGNAVASLLLGDPSGGIIQNTPILAYRWGYYGFYFQDDMKVSRKLTLNMGLRYDVEGSPTERYNRMNRGFTSGASPLAGAVQSANPGDCPACANLIGGLQFVSGSNRSAFATEYTHFQPRFGAAYAWNSKTVIRGGVGIFYLPEAAYGGSAGFAADTSFVSTIGGGANGFIPANTLSNPFPTGLVQPTGSSLGAGTFLGNNIIFSNPTRSIPHTAQYSFGVQRQLPGAFRIDASYVGSRTYDINTNDNQAGAPRNLNVNTPDQLARARQDSNYFNQAVANPFAGLLPNNPGLNGATIRRQQLLLPFPQFGSVQEAQESIGKIWYDSLQVNVEKRYSANLVLVAAYTFSKNLESVQYLNDQDARPSKVLTSQDRPHRLVLSGVYGLPFGKGRKFLGGVNRGWEQLIGGWEYNFIGTLQSGTPLVYPSNVDLIGNPAIDGSSFDNYFNSCVQQLNGTALAPDPSRNGKFVSCANPVFAIRGPNTLRSIPFRSGGQIRNPWAKQWDMSLNKRFNISERFNAQFRLEAFNIFNTPILGAPNTNPTDSNFGLVTRNQSNFPRQVQLGFKFNF